MATMGTLHNRLHGGLWHVTHPDRFLTILASGGLQVEPEIPNSERWTSSRPEGYSFVRHIGGISLFDFSEFDPDCYEAKYPISNWYDFVPHPRAWGGAVWIEIDREAVSHSLLSADQLRELWDRDGQRNRKRMPEIESAYVGNMPKMAFRSTFLAWQQGREARDINLDDQPAITKLLNEWGTTL